MKRRLTRICTGLALACFTFQATCAVTETDIQNALNSATNGFINSLFAQWLGVKVDALLDVD